MEMGQNDVVEQDKNPASVLKKYFGYDSFRTPQDEVIQEVMAGRDVLVLMPTGGGKSVCYQVPAMVMPGICVVISPLIALMKDQVEGLRLNGIPAAFLNSTQGAAEQNEVERLCRAGAIKLLYVSPEKVFTDNFQWLVKQIKVNLFAVDEAHCVSFWGHDFRPEYAQLKILKDLAPDTPVIALTATADKLTRRDILQRLQLRDAKVFISSFDRPNLRLNVMPGLKRIQRIFDFLEKHEQEAGIIYCLSRKSTETVAGKLQQQGYKAEAYHAGLSADTRARVQDAFIKDNIQVVCATIAFGMGIDKSNVRWVIHYNLPRNIESYYQEIGRSGRDGQPAEALLFYAYSDVAMQAQMLSELPDEQREIQQSKLERLQQYTETVFCRRQVLLNYFNEGHTGNCGNCDNCLYPRKMQEATLVAQKSLSAIARMREQATLGTVVEVLRGNKTRAVVEQGFDKIKTFGQGRDLGALEWRDFLQQMVNIGLLEIAYDDGSKLKLNNASREVLFDGRKVQLAEPQIKMAKEERGQSFTKEASKSSRMEEELFQELRKLRKHIAEEENLPPYLVFNDNTLREMAKEKPVTHTAMLDIPGVGQHKYDKYGREFMDKIMSYVQLKTEEGNRIKGGTHLVTYNMLREGKDLDEIAKARGISEVTVFSHLASLYEGGYDIQLDSYLSPQDREVIAPYIKEKGLKTSLKELYTGLEEQYTYGQIRLALAWVAREG